MESTREKIFALLRLQREVTIDDLTRALDLAPATVRRHLDILQRDGHVAVRPVRRETGRPHYSFSLTRSGEDHFPQHYIRITSRLIDEIVALRPDETSGKTGLEIAGLIFQRMAEGLARSYEGRISGTTLAERLDQTVAALADEGIVFEVSPRGDAFLLVGRDCPCRHIADQHRDVCRYDERLLRRLLGAGVALTSVPEAGEGCAYLAGHRS